MILNPLLKLGLMLSMLSTLCPHRVEVALCDVSQGLLYLNKLTLCSSERGVEGAEGLPLCLFREPDATVTTGTRQHLFQLCPRPGYPVLQAVGLVVYLDP